jgi:plastocyanin
MLKKLSGTGGLTSVFILIINKEVKMKNIVHAGKLILVLAILTGVLLMAGCSSVRTTTPATIPSMTTPATTTPISTAPPTATIPPATIASATPAAAPATTPSNTPAPSIQITAPGSGNIFGIGKVTVTVQVSNFDLVNQLGKANSAGQGHIHYYMDVDAPVTAGKPAVTAPGTFVPTSDTTLTWINIGGGSHKFSVELVNNDHTPLSPPVVDSKTVLVIPEIGPPGMVILSPRDNSIVQGSDVTISVQASNFNLVEKLGQSNTPREGHLHYFMDVDAPTTAGKPAVTAAGTYAATASDTYTWKNVSPGQHTFSAELINNDHTPLSPPVVSKITVTVAGAQATSTATSPAVGSQTAIINLIAKGMAFDKPTLSVPAGASVTINFDNQDAGIPHNVSVYQTMPNGDTTPVFIGDVIKGPSTIVYHFTAPATQGNYYFVCDIHPQVMKGPFVITP